MAGVFKGGISTEIIDISAGLTGTLATNPANTGVFMFATIDDIKIKRSDGTVVGASDAASANAYRAALTATYAASAHAYDLAIVDAKTFASAASAHAYDAAIVDAKTFAANASAHAYDAAIVDAKTFASAASAHALDASLVVTYAASAHAYDLAIIDAKTFASAASAHAYDAAIVDAKTFAANASAHAYDAAIVDAKTFASDASANAYNLAITEAKTYAAAASSSVYDATVHLTGDQSIAGIKTFTNNVVVSGNLFVSGTTTTVSSQELIVSDNIIVINSGEPGPGVTKGFAGIQVDRGSPSAAYWFVFDEARDVFAVGISGSTQAVATREDNPLASGIPRWNATTSRFETVTADSITGAALAASYAASAHAYDLAIIEARTYASDASANAYNLAITDAKTFASAASAHAYDASLVVTYAASAHAYDLAIIDAKTFASAASANAYDLAVNEAKTLSYAASAHAYDASLVVTYAASAHAYDLAIIDAKTFASAASANAYNLAVTEAKTFAANASAHAYDASVAYTNVVSGAITSNLAAMVQGGKISCTTSNYVYEVTHSNSTVATSFPIVSLTIPVSSSIMYVQGITNRTTTSFNVVLSDIPDVAGYEINWVLLKAYGS
jgi:hypothetical protein